MNPYSKPCEDSRNKVILPHHLKLHNPLRQPNTIDEKHTQMLQYFHELETHTIPFMEKELCKLKELPLKPKIEERLLISEQIEESHQQIRQLKRKRKKYLLNNSKYIFNYFESKKDIAEGGGGTKNTDKMNNFFKLKSSENEPTLNINHPRYSQSKAFYNQY